jgi:chromosomal replication initiator protein
VGVRSGGNRTATAILDGIAAEFDVLVSDIVSPRRTARVAEARQAAIFLCRELTDLSLAAIGRRIGGRDHSTVVYALARAVERREKEPGFRQRLDRVTRGLAGE